MQGTATVGKRAVKLRYREQRRVTIALRAKATIARAKRVKVKATRGLRASL